MFSALKLTDSQGGLLWTSIGVLAFAAVFLVVGLLRIVEFGDVGFSSLIRGVLIGIHVAGCLLFTAALALFALDPLQAQKQLMIGFFSAGMLTLFPTHIYVALKRRIKYGSRPTA